MHIPGRSLGRAVTSGLRRLEISAVKNPRLPDELPGTWRRRLERLLLENVVPFWNNRVVDKSGGGYHEEIGPPGSRPRPGAKHPRTQSRTLWYFSRLLRSPYGGPAYHAPAEHGFKYLSGPLWDQKRGGVRGTGEATGESVKHAYDQAMALDALVEYYRATGSTRAEGLAHDVLDTLVSRFRDGSEGYWEGLTYDWEIPDAPGLLVRDPTTKTTSTHVNALHALANAHACGLADLTSPIQELLSLLDGRAVLPGGTMMGEVFTQDWSATVGPPTVSYGHDIERIWMANGARRVTGDSPASYIGLFEEITRWGWDRRRGGFFFSGPPRRPAGVLKKRWWVQAEALVACALLRESQAKLAGSFFEGSLRWIESYQADWNAGEWYDTVALGGAPVGKKAWEWKTGYHTTRSLLGTLELLGDRAE